MQWCCIGFKSHYESAGERGPAYLVGRDSLGAPEFMIQYRTVDKGNEDQINSTVEASIITDSRIVYCPSCGTDLADFYSRDIDSLHREGFELGILKKDRNEPLTLIEKHLKNFSLVVS